MLTLLHQWLSQEDKGASDKPAKRVDIRDDDDTMDEEELVIDSPDQSPVEDEDLSDVEDMKLGRPAKAVSAKQKDKDGDRTQFLVYPESLPYQCESLQEMDDQLNVIIQRISQAVQAKDYDIGFLQWDHRLECWMSLKYPMRRSIRAKLAKLYYELAVLPGMDARLVEVAAGTCMVLLSNKKHLDINDLQLPWQPLHDILERELFPKKRKTGITNISSTLLSLTEYCQRFFPPHEAHNMLSTFLPKLDGTSLNSILATQSYMAHFLPISHPQSWLTPSFVLWDAFSNSQIYTEQWLDVMARLAEKHMDPSISDPKLVEKYRLLYEQQSGSASPKSSSKPSFEAKMEASDIDGIEGSSKSSKWKGIRKDVGIFTIEQWDLLMQKTLRAMGVPVGNVNKSSASFLSQGEVGAANADSAANATILKMKKPTEKLHSLAVLLIYSMSNDSPVLDKTPAGSKLPSRSASQTNLAFTLGTSSPVTPPTPTKPQIGGSRALGSLVTLINATETFFHPSNYGRWTYALARFLQNITWEFTKRWSEEEKADCKTPQEWRLTPRIRREFVLATRQVAFLAMFSKDPLSMGAAQSALKSMSFLEPSLVLPAVLEKSFPALEGLLETHRTTACMGALAAVALPMVSRTNFPAGSKNLLPLLDLCIPGLDVNDPLKTLSSVAFIIQALSTVKIDDLTQVEALDEPDAGASMQLDGVSEPPPPSIEVDDTDSDSGPVLSRQDEDMLTRESTADFPEWISKFFLAVLALYDHLPEPGKTGKAGGKLEESMISTVTVACDFVLSQCSPAIYDVALQIFTRHVIGAPRANSARAIGHLAACFGRADPAKALAALLPVCLSNIRLELENGASATRTTSTSTPIESDNSFHWYCLLLLGALHMGAEEALKYKKELLELCKLMRDKCFSERGYTYAGRMLQAVLASMTAIWTREGRSANPDEWNSEDFHKRSHQYWGQLYLATEVKIDWHQPTEKEIDFAMELLREVVGPAVEALEKLAEPDATIDKDWRNDFNRYTNLVRSALTGISSLTTVCEPEEPGERVTDIGDEDWDFIKHIPRCEYGAPLKDPSDPRFQEVMQLKSRMQAMLHKAILRLTAADEKSQDAIDSVRMAISTSKHIMLSHPMDRSAYGAVKANFTFARDLAKYTVNQKKFPRLIWVRRASLYHASRLRLNTFYRSRSALDDQLIRDIAECCMSKYVNIRRAAQKALESITHLYDGARTLLLPTFFEALKPGNDPDRMKGALYVLGSKSFGNMAILDWNVGPTYLMRLLSCQHEQKPSIQQLVKAVTQDFLIRLAEPSTIKLCVTSSGARKAAVQLEEISAKPSNTALVESLGDYNGRRIESRNVAYSKLVPELLAVAKDPNSHWRYSLTATRFLRALIRRDQPIPVELSTYLASQVISELPNQRTTAILAVTKILHFIKLRTYCENDEDLLLQRTQNPLKKEVQVPTKVPADYTEQFLGQFRSPVVPESTLIDKRDAGWLVWGKSFEGYAVPAEMETEWDPASKDAIAAIGELVTSRAFWDAMLKNLGQEHTRDYLALDNVTVIKSIFQIYMDAPLDAAIPTVTELMTDNDRHKQRAAAEFIGGLLRGLKHWPPSKQKRVQEWLAPQWQKIFDSINLDTQPAWEMMVEYVLGNRDPRRSSSLVDFLTSLSVDIESSEAFKEARKGYLVGSTMKSLSWHFSAWIPDFADTFWGAITSPYTEVRMAISDNLRYLSEMPLHPSFPSVDAFVDACNTRHGMQLLVGVNDKYIQRIDALVESLAKLRSIRQPFSRDAVQPYDSACLTVLTWLWSGMNDYRVTTIYPFVERLLPELMQMQDMQDNQELQKWATVVLATMAALPYPASLVPSVLDSFLTLFQSTSWRTRLAVLPLLQVFFFHQLFTLSEEQVQSVIDLLCGLLKDGHIEVREAAATTLSGIIRCSQRDSVLIYKNRFLSAVRKTPVPGKKDVNSANQDAFQASLVEAHAAVLGASALVLAWPYEVPSWLPELLLATITKFSTSRAPVSTTVKDLLAQFRKTHQDTWTEDQKKFTSDQLQDLNDLVIGTSYYA